LDVHRAANYVLLKPTNFRRTPYDNSIHFTHNPVEIKLFQVMGIEVEETTPSTQDVFNSIVGAGYGL
jgi:ubiquitin-activating enzyme E1